MVYAGILQPTNKRMKQLIKEFGRIWMVDSLTPIPMQCFNGDLGFPATSENGRHSRNLREEQINVPF